MAINRRHFLTAAALSPIVAFASCRLPAGGRRSSARRLARFFFVSQGQTALINADGTGVRYLDFDVPNQATWQPADFFADGRRVLFLSMEPRRDGPGRPFEEYYTQTPTHLWIYDLESGSLKEIATRDRMAPFYAPQLLLGDERMLVQVVRNKVGQTFSMNLDGTDAREFTRAGEGLPYGLSQKSPGAEEAPAEMRGDHQGTPCLHRQTPQGAQSHGGDTLTGLRGHPAL